MSYFFSLADMLVKEIWREVSCKTIYIIYLKDEMYHYIRYIFDDEFTNLSSGKDHAN